MRISIYRIPALLILVYQLNLGIAQNIPRSNAGGPPGIEINTFTGNLFYQRSDFFVPGRGVSMDMTFYYNLKLRHEDIGYGFGWNFTYSMRYELYNGNPDSLSVVWPDGRKDLFVKSGGDYIPPTGIFDKLEEYTTGRFKLTTKHKMEYFFDEASHKGLTKIQEPNGNAITIAYSGGHPSSITDASGRQLSLDWIGGHLESITDALDPPARTFTFQYDNVGQMVKVTNPLSDFTSYEYGPDKELVVITDYNQNPTVIYYHESNATKQLLTCESAQSFSYDAESGKSYLVENGSQSTAFEYDDQGRIVSMQGNCCGYHLKYDYDGDNNVNTIIDANNQSVQATYFDSGNLATLADPLGHEMSMEYEPEFNLVNQFVDREQNTTSMEYDNSNLTTINRPLGITESFSYDGNGNLNQVVDGEGNTTLLTSNSNGDITNIDYEIGSESFSYDNRGNMATATDGNNHTYQFEYDALNRLVQITDPLSNNIAYQYDANGNLTSETDENQHVRNYNYDALNRLRQVDDFTGSTAYTYDEVSNLASITNANGYTASFSYNRQNLMASETDAEGFTNTYEYDAAGNLIRKTDANGNTTTYTYDEADRLIGKIYDGNSDYYEYDNNGNLTHCHNNDIAIDYTYDELNRLTSKNITTWGKIIRYTYDNAGNRQTMTDPDEGLTTYAYDGNNQLTSIANPLGEVTIFNYDAGGRLVRQENHNGAYVDLEFDEANRLTSIENKASDGSVLSSYTYTHDDKGNRLSMTDLSGTHQYAYDEVDRLTDVRYANGTTVNYVFDNAGNRLQEITNGNPVDYSYDRADRIQSAGPTSFGFDNNGNMISKTENGQATLYTYDGEDRLIKVELPGGEEISYRYDPLGQRISRIVSSGSITYYVHDGPNLLMELDNSYNTLARYTAALSYDSWISMRRDGQTYYYHKDGLGSVVGMSDASESLAKTYDYDVYGNILNSVGTVINTITFTGRNYDNVPDLFYSRNRYLDARNGRFITKDPFRGFQSTPLSLNPYLYVGNNPTNYVDPNGLVWQFLLGAYIGLAESFIIENAASGGQTTLQSFFSKENIWNRAGDALIGAAQLGGFNSVYKHFKYAIKGEKKLNRLKQLGLGFRNNLIMKPPNTQKTVRTTQLFYTKLTGLHSELMNRYFLNQKTQRGGINIAAGLFYSAFTTFRDHVFNPLEYFLNQIEGTQNGSQPENGETKEVNIPTVQSYDPNEMVPPEGTGAENWVSVNAVLPYTILFENHPDSAMVSAQRVYIKYPFGEHVDTLSFELGDLGFGAFYVEVPPNHDYYKSVVDADAITGVDVEIEAGIRRDSNYAFWRFTSLDPITGAPTMDPFAGFLAVNDSTGRGEGFVNFIISPDPNAQTFDEIRPEASIYFDANPPILTPNDVFNTIDADFPVSEIATDVIAPDSTSIQINWTGADVGSGLASYDIYVSKDSGPFVKWLSATTATTGVYPAELDHSYCFFSVATDNVSNTESIDSCNIEVVFTPDLITSVEPIPPKQEPSFVLYQNQPNPFQAGTTIPFYIPDAAKIKLVISDLNGRIVKVLLDQSFSAGYHEVFWDGASNSGKLASGIYIYNLIVNNEFEANRMLLLR